MIPGIMASEKILALKPPGPTLASLDPNYIKNGILLLGNGANGSTTFTDQIGNTWAPSGDAKNSSTGPKYGAGCLLFDGAGDYLSATIPSLIGIGDFTVESWLYIASLASDGEIICAGPVGNVSAFDLVFEYKTSGALRGSVQNSGTTIVDISSSGGLLTTGAWNHVAFTAEGTTARLRINGAVVATGTLSGTRGNAQSSVRIGHLSTDLGGVVTRYLNGRLDDLRFTKGVCRYPGSGAYTPPAAQLPSFPLAVLNSSFTASGTTDAQGVATDGTYVWFSNSTTIFKYDHAGTLVTSRVVSGDNPTDKVQINGMHYRSGRLYVSAAKFVSGIGTSWIVEYDPTTLAYIDHHLLAGDHFSEGITWRDGYWWVCFHANKEVCRFDRNWILRATYPLSFSITGSSGGYGAGTGYDGIAWYGDYLLCNVHEIYNEDFLDVYAWTGTGFAEVIRLPRPDSIASQGIAMDPSDTTVMWFAGRNYSGTDRVEKIKLV